MATGELVGNFGTVAAVSREATLLRIENESFHAMAVAHPRDFKTIADDMRKQFELFPSFAKAAIYSKPVGKDADNNERVARNLSVRAAEAIAEAYGYCRVRTNVELIDGHPDLVRVEAYFTDLQKAKTWEDSAIVSKIYTDRHKNKVRIPDDRFFSVTVRAAQSKLVREVILRSVAPGLRLELFDMAEKATAKLLDDKEIDKIVDSFATRKVTLEMIEKFIGRPRAVGWTDDDRLNLLGVWNAIKDGETTVDAAFGDSEEPVSGPKAPNTVNDFVNGKKPDSSKIKPASEVEPKPEVKSEQKPEKASVRPEVKTESSKPADEPKADRKSLGTAGYRALIVSADSEARFREIGEMINLDKDLAKQEKTALIGMAQRKAAEFIKTTTKPVLSEAIQSYMAQLEKVTDPSGAEAVMIDVLGDDTLSESDREYLMVEIGKKSD